MIVHGWPIRNKKDPRKSIQEGKDDVPHFLISVWILLPYPTSLQQTNKKVELSHKTLCVFSEEMAPLRGPVQPCLFSNSEWLWGVRSTHRDAVNTNRACW